MASNPLADIIEELNRNCENGDLDNDTEDTEGDVAFEEFRDVDLTGLDDDEVLAESKKVSMFCRNCLSPYRGERGQAGSIILKCGKCYHRDIITEDDLHEADPGHTESLAKGGNIILNRFSKVLLENTELQNIDVDDPLFMDDEYQQLCKALPRITGTMKQTFSEMHKVTDEHRKVHNMEMIRMLKQEGNGDELETEDGQPAMKFTVSTYGSEEGGDLVILPEKYKLPEEAMEQFRNIGRLGIQKVDKFILSVGVKVNQFKRLPLFQSRLLGYCKLSQGQGQDSKSNDNAQNSQVKIPMNETQSTNSQNVLKYDKEPDKFVVDAHILEMLNIDKPKDCLPDTENDGNIQSEKPKDSLVDANSESITNRNILSDKDIPNTQIENTELSDIGKDNQSEASTEEDGSSEMEKVMDEHKTPLKENKKIKQKYETACGGSDVNCDGNDTDHGIESSNCAPEEVGANSESSGSGSDDEPDDAHKIDLIPELNEFSNILQCVEEQQKISENIPEEIVVFHESEPLTHINLNEAYNEITSSMIIRATRAKQQRMVDTMAMIKRSAKNMAEQVDQVQDEMIKELQIAYRSKRIKADVQKKRLEETQETLEYYRGLISHYQQTGDFQKILEILEILKDYESEN